MHVSMLSFKIHIYLIPRQLMKYRLSSAFLVAILVALSVFCSQTKAEDGPDDYYNVGDSIITTPIFIHGNHLSEDGIMPPLRLIVPTVILPLTDQSKVAVTFTFFDCDNQQTLEAVLDEEASHIHADCHKHFDDISHYHPNLWDDLFSDNTTSDDQSCFDPWLTRGSNGFDFNTVIAHTSGKTTLYYTVTIPAHREGWTWSLTPEKKIIVEIPAEFVEERSIDID